jgi:glycosyltransferase involved in cell wall biosynthesis
MSRSDQPWLSVILPTYQGERYLRAALDSIAAQTGPQIECIIVDDGSTDGTLPLVADWQVALPPDHPLTIRLINQPHAGNWVASTNTGLNNATGEWVSILHQDDRWATDRTRTLHRLTQTHPHIHLFLHPARFIDHKGQRIGRWRCPLPPHRELAPEFVLPRLIVQNFVPIVSPLIRRTALLDIGPMNESLWYFADWDYWLRLAEKNHVFYVPEQLAAFRVHPASQTARRTRNWDDIGQQFDLVTSRALKSNHYPQNHVEKSQEMVKFAREMYQFLLAGLHGGQKRYGKLIKQALRIGPIGWHRYLRDTRLRDRTLPRLRLKMTAGTQGTDNAPPHDLGTQGTDNAPPHDLGTQGTDNAPPHDLGTQGTDNAPPHDLASWEANVGPTPPDNAPPHDLASWEANVGPKRSVPPMRLSLDRPLYFLHIQKTAGTTVAAYLKGLFRPEESMPGYFWDELMDLPAAERERYRLILGHYDRSYLSLCETPPAIVTFLRDPVKRLRSYWAHVRRAPDHPMHAVLNLDSFLAVLRSEEGKKWLYNGQARALGMDIYPDLIAMKNRYGDKRPPEYAFAIRRHTQMARHTCSDSELIDRAQALLDQCLFVGIQEQLDEAMPILAAKLGAAPPSPMPLTNTAPPSDRVPLSDEETEMARQLTRLDDQVYAYARRLFESQKAQYNAAQHLADTEQKLAAASVPLNHPLCVDLANPVWGRNWWPAERLADGDHLRWTGPAPEAVLNLPIRLTRTTRIRIRVFAVVPPHLPEHIRIRCNDHELAPHFFAAPSGIDVIVTCPASPDTPWTQLAITCPTRPWVEIHPETHDPGARGVAISKIEFKPQ